MARKSGLAEAWEALIGAYEPAIGGVLERRQLDDLYRALTADSGGARELSDLDRAYALLALLFGAAERIWVLPEQDEASRVAVPRLTPPGAIARALPARRFPPMSTPLSMETPVGEGSKIVTPPLFGRYLLGEGFINVGELSEAISWQRAQRPAVGQIAVDWRILTPAQVATLLDSKPKAQLFCDYAVSRGLMGNFERLAVLAKQRRLQRPIGQFFVERGIMTREQVEALARRVAR